MQTSRTLSWLMTALVMAALLLGSACTRASTVSPPTPSQAPTPTQVPTPTQAATATQAAPTPPQPSPTPAPTPTPEAPAGDPLEARLYTASLKYLADNTAAADAVAQKIGYLGGKTESASLACGPLSAAILKDGGYLSQNTSTHEIWLLCARDDRPECNGIQTLQRQYFPPQEYDYLRFRKNIREYDFTANPLLPGDWMYLFVTKGGFDHMLTVTRVDPGGAAYTVTNLDRGDGFKIVEAMLYDPAQPGKGLFYELTDPNRKELGMSGNGGFLLVRRRGGSDFLPTQPRLDAALAPGGRWNALVMDITAGRTLYESLPNETFHPASMIKVPLAMAVLKVVEDQGLTVADLPGLGRGGRSLDELLSATLVNSEEEAADLLLKYIRAHTSERAILTAWGAQDTTFEPRRTTAFDLALMLKGLYQGTFLSPASSEYILNLLAVQTKNDAHYLGLIPRQLPGSVFYNKRGTLTNPSLIVGDMGILTDGHKVYIIVLCGRPQKAGSTSFEELQAGIENFATELARIIQNAP